MLLTAIGAHGQQPTQTPFTGRALSQAEVKIEAETSGAQDQVTPFAVMQSQATSTTGFTFPGFLSPAHYNAGVTSLTSGVYASVEGDFDGKNGTDIVAIQGSGRINVLLNNGKGQFTATYGAALATTINAASADGADFNGDGLPDLVLADSSSATCQVFLNQGNATFGTTPLKLAAVRPTGLVGSQIIGSVKTGDVNGDGIPDIVFPVTYLNTTTSTGTLIIFTFKGDGHGNFAAAVTTSYPVSTYSYVVGGHSVELADLGKTGKLSLILQMVTTNNSGSLFAESLMAAPGNGDGTFGKLSTAANAISSTTYGRGTLSVHDFDGDGYLDVLFADGGGGIQLARGSSSGTLQTATTVVSGVGATASLVVGDFNHDTIYDVVAIQSGLAMVFNGLGSGTFNNTPAAQYAGGLVGIQPIASADFDSDGQQDFIWIEPAYNQMNVYFGLGNSTFRGTAALSAANTGSATPNNTEPATTFSVLAAGQYLTPVRKDVLLQEGDHLDLGVYKANGAFTLTPAITSHQLADVDFVEPLAVDLNGDGKTDVLMATLTGVKTALSNGDGTFAATTSTTIPITLGCVLGYGSAADINGDGIQDLVLGYTGDAYCYASTTSPSGYATLLGDGKGGFQSSKFTSYGNATGTVRLADMNNDGILDMVVVDIAYGKYAVTILPGLSNGLFDTAHPRPVYSSTAYRVSDVRAADMDGDGYPDLLMNYYGALGSQAVLFVKNKGNFSFNAPAAVFTGATGPFLEVNDFNGDGLPDFGITLATTSNRTLSDLAVVLNTGNGTFASPTIYTMPYNASSVYPKLLFSGDFNADGAIDLMMGNGALYVPNAVFLNQGGTSWQLTAQPAAPLQGSPVQLVAQASILSSSLSGSVTFTSSGKVLGTAPVVGTLATLTVPSLPAGTDVIEANYTGDSTHPATNATPLSLVVTALPGAFSMTGSPNALTITQGASGGQAITITTNSTFAGTVVLSCIDRPLNTECSFTPSTITLGANASVTSQLSLTTSQAGLTRPAIFPRSGAVLAAVLLMVPLTTVKRRRFATSLTAALVLFLSGCSSYSPTQTPVGTTLLTVQATATLASGSQLVQTILVPVTINKH